jgi:plasmid stability protein
MEIYQIANVNVRNLPDEVHRAIRIQAAHHGRSTEAQALETLYLSVITVAELLAKSRAAGLAVETADAFIAAVALANSFAVAMKQCQRPPAKHPA